jgi:hypothetical protein
MTNLIQRVIYDSESSIWSSVVTEWYIFDCQEDENHEISCICGQENLRYLFTIKNKLNGNILFPIGSECIKKFDRGDLNDEVSVHEQLFKLLHAVESKKFIRFNSSLFSRRLLFYLFENNAFKGSQYNGFDSESDYRFMLNMFNKRNEPTEKQKRKINAIIISEIKPFLQKTLKTKILSNSNERK